jgi:hypothetical protein
MQNASEDFRFAASVAWFGLKLRDSELITNKSIENIISAGKRCQSFRPGWVPGRMYQADGNRQIIKRVNSEKRQGENPCLSCCLKALKAIQTQHLKK